MPDHPEPPRRIPSPLVQAVSWYREAQRRKEDEAREAEIAAELAESDSRRDREYQVRIQAFLEELLRGKLNPLPDYAVRVGDFVAARMQKARAYFTDLKRKDPRSTRTAIQSYVEANRERLAKPPGERGALPLDPTTVAGLEADPHTMPPRTGQGGRRKDWKVQLIYKNIRDIERQSGRRGFALVQELQQRNVPLPSSRGELGTSWRQAYGKAPARVRNYLHRARKAE